MLNQEIITMWRIRIVTLLLVAALSFAPTTLSASTITYAVGTCRPTLRSFASITAALAATPVANVVVVCPGTYQEQVEISHTVTLQGVSNGDSGQAIIAPPPGGLVTNAITDFGVPLDVQLWVNNTSGPVNISDITVDASGNGVSNNTFVVGIFYHNSPGTVNRVTTRNQSGNTLGEGILTEGGSSRPMVTIENSSVHNYDFAGIVAETNSATPELSAVIKGNEVTTSQPSAEIGIDIVTGTTLTVASNVVVHAGTFGIQAFTGSAGSISANTVVNGVGAYGGPAIGIYALAEGVSVTSNQIFGGAQGVQLGTSSVAAVQNNSITHSEIGIEFNCVADPNVHSNVITDAGTGVDQVPSAISTSNTYFNVGTVHSGC
jgi:hypothetical protein